MTNSTEMSADVPSSASLAIYVYAIRHGGVTAGDPTLSADLDLPGEVIESSLTQLQELRLLRREFTSGWWRLVPVSPEVAAASLISPIGEEIYRQHAVISQIQSRLTMFQPHYEANRGTASAATTESIQDATELSGQLHLAAERCRRDFVGFRPDGLLPLQHVAAMSARGVCVRLLFAHSLRTDLRARAALKEIVASGGLVRTVGRPPRRLIIFDDSAAFLLDGEEPGVLDGAHPRPPYGAHPRPPDGADPGPVGVIIRHEETVRLLRGVVEMTWTGAEPYSATEIGYHEVTHDMQRTIVDLLASGFTDDVIARRLGISVRTCRRHIASVLSALDAVSRFQAGALAVTVGLLDAQRLRASAQ
jgi:DNA-binding CsgD family transcriptional regulator